jgi:hypothetical protein
VDKKLGILITHGIGTSDSSFADKMIVNIKAEITKSGHNADSVVFVPCAWDNVMKPKEEALWEKINNNLQWVTARKFCVNAVADAMAYQETNNIHGGSYDQIHDYIRNKLIELRAMLGEDKPLVMISHSLGCHILSNYIWDREYGYYKEEYGGDNFLEMKTLIGFITYGCNIPLFVLEYDNIIAIDFPHRECILKNLLPFAKWLNYYDKNDVLGYPLKCLSETYNKSVTEDIEIGVGSVFTFWNPLSHMEYKNDKKFIKQIAIYLCELLKNIK